MKKVLVLCLALAIAVGTAISGTVAYLQDTDEQVNSATVGNVEIEQLEYQRADKTNHTGSLKDGGLVEYEQHQNLYPAFPVNNTATDYSAEQNDLIYWGPYVTANGAGNGLWNPNKLVGAMDKMVFVENTGDSPCYYRTWLAFECPEGMEYSQTWDKEFMMNVNGHSLFDWENLGYAEIVDNDTGKPVRYLVMTATYTAELAADEISRPSLLQVVMTHNATNEQVALLDGSYEILAFTQAVQTENFKDATLPEGVGSHAELALNAAFWTPGEKSDDETLKTPWGDGYVKPTKLPEGFPEAEVVWDRDVNEFEVNGAWNGGNLESGNQTLPLQSGLYTFSTTETPEEAAQNEYKDWIADYYVTFDRDVNQTEGEVEIALVGYYEAYDAALAVYAPLTTDLMPLPLLGSTIGDWTYEMIATGVREFKCGVSVDPFNAGLDVEPFNFNVELRMTNPEDTAEFYVLESFDFSYNG